VFIFMLVRLRL